MELWTANYQELFDSLVSDGILNDYGPAYGGGPQYWMLPTNFANKHRIKKVEDMAKPEVVSALRDEGSAASGKPIFYTCIAEWTACSSINREKMDAYGLSDLYEIVTPDSAEDLEMQFIDAQERRLPVFGYYYAPTALMGRLEVVSWMILNEPEYTTRCWREIEAALDDPTYTAREACAYDSRPILKGAHSGLRDRAPEIAEVLQEIDLGSHPVSLSAAWVHDNGIDPVTDWERVAEYYLGAFESRWIKWVSDDAAKRIRAALERS